jgi:putative oxygen-independent coproporphyrinogen III oxidase
MQKCMTTTHPLALYVHWPFCIVKCPYCDFNSHVRDDVDQERWLSGLLADMSYEASMIEKRPLTSIFFGGGTPSLMPPATVAAIIENAEQIWGFAPDIEITLEANPSSVEAARFADVAAAGVNRVSLGMQALNDDALRFLGRPHDLAEGLTALDMAQRLFNRVSFDLIYALPGQSESSWAGELARALAFGTDHLSLYQLTIEPGTRFATLAAQGLLSPMSPDSGATLFEMTRDMTVAASLPAYEVSNHARLGDESRHNLTYWRYGEYLGIGPGAHGRRGGLATIRHKKPENWLSAVARNGHGLQSEDTLTPEDKAREALLMGLRLREGVDLGRISANTGFSPEQLINQKAAALLESHELLTYRDNQLTITGAGMLLLDRILTEIVAV